MAPLCGSAAGRTQTFVSPPLAVACSHFPIPLTRSRRPGVLAEGRTLTVGDVLWIARNRRNPSEEYCLVRLCTAHPSTSFHPEAEFEGDEE